MPTFGEAVNAKTTSEERGGEESGHDFMLTLFGTNEARRTYIPLR